ncbi:chemoreceptor glutamine deamidase CheD [Thioalkalivibrio sulfidiphilus]|uniref:chemoreceptor glutamine deamidase CheD n=1 Tax=Thioalkalivibrio sulfidiphilus TaxID=1033854 RepID=UPI000363C4F6|nr:chemoreceptor glutamine deamidase CheD [Thioalkalivibrio sulfidiphilus]
MAQGVVTRLSRANSARPPPPVLPGYEHINRYWDPTHDRYAAKILPGEYYVTLYGELITTVLGSCVSACVRDRKLGIGGMNHFMLPHSERVEAWGGASAAARYGSYAMETLINDILKNGGRREHLEVKIFGGGQVLAQMTDVGRKNIAFVREFIRVEGLNLVAEDLGGPHPRKVVFFPDSGRVRIKKLRAMHNETIVQRETRYMAQLQEAPVQGEVELF